MVETIKRLCKEQRTSIAAIEKICKLGNGSIRKWDQASPSLDRVTAVANALGVSVAYLTGEEEKSPATQKGSGEDEVTDQLLSFLRSATPEEQQEIANYIEFIKSKRK